MDEKATRLTASIKAITAEVKSDPSWEGEKYLTRNTYVVPNTKYVLKLLR